MSTANSLITLSTRLQQLNSAIQDNDEGQKATSAAVGTSTASAAPQTSSMATTSASASSVVEISAAGAQKSATAQALAAAVNYTNQIKKTGDINIDALLAGGNAWFHTAGASGEIPSATARHSLTYSFFDANNVGASDANGFQVMDDAHKQAVRDALSYISTVVDLSFTEVASGGDISYGTNVQAASAGYARYPNQGAQVFLANNQGSYNSGQTGSGSYTWEVILHETSHALGLKHPGNYNAGGGGTPGPYLPKASDNRGNTIMSYTDASNTKLVSRSGNSYVTQTLNPSTLQANDIAALQYLYGASASAAAQDFSWSDAPVMSQTIWSGNTDSSIDLSNQTGTNIVDLRAGKFSSIGVRDAYADVGGKAAYTALKTVVNGKTVSMSTVLGVPTYTGTNNLKIAAGSHINQAVGGSGNDSFVSNGEGNSLSGGLGNDAFFLTGGDDVVQGGDGDDTVYLKTVSGATWTLSDDRSTATLTKTTKDPVTKQPVTTTLSTVTLSGVEHVAFWAGSTLKGSGALWDEFSGGAGNDTFIAKGNSEISGGDGTNAYFVGGNATVAGGSGDDTIYLKKVAGATWSFNADRSTATLQKAGVDPITKQAVTTTLSTVTMTGIEHIGFWNGSSAVKSGAMAFDKFTGGAGNDSFVATGDAVIQGGDGTNQYYVSGNTSVTGGSGQDTVYLKKTAGATWSLSADGSVATLVKMVRDATTRQMVPVTVNTVNMSGVEHVAFWNGTSPKPLATPAPLSSQVRTLLAAYATSSETAKPQVDTGA